MLAIYTCGLVYVHTIFSPLQTGNILAFRKFNGDFIAESYPVPPTKNDLIKHQTLDADLARFSLTCTTCVDRTRLLFERGSTQVYVVLSDEALSVIQIETSEEILSTVTQVWVHIASYIHIHNTLALYVYTYMYTCIYMHGYI